MAVQYTDLVNKSGTIYNTKTGVGYSNPTNLATDLGVDSKAINWSNIKSDPAWTYSAPSTTATTTTTTPQTFSFMDKSLYDVNQNPLTVSNSSSSADQAIDNLGTNINKAQNDFSLQSLLDLYKTTSEKNAATFADSQKFIQDRQSQLDKRREEEIARLNAEYDTAKATKEADYQKIVQPFQRRLQLLNETPYGPNAQVEEDLKFKLANLEQTHKLEMDTLFNSRQSFIAQAQSAYEDKNFALAESQLKLASEAEKNMYDRQQDFLNMSLKFQEEQRSQQLLDYNMAAEQRKQTDDLRKFALDNGLSPTAQFFAAGGQIFDTRTWKAFDSKEQAVASGVKADLSNVQMISDQGTGIVGEYNKFLQDVALGKEKYMTFNQYQDRDANRKAKIAAAGVVSAGDTRAYDLLVKQAPASVPALKAKGYSWQAIAELFQNQGVDPGTPEIDDALHRSFQSQGDYENWKKEQAKAKKGVSAVSTSKNKQGQTVILYSDGTQQILP